MKALKGTIFMPVEYGILGSPWHMLTKELFQMLPEIKSYWKQTFGRPTASAVDSYGGTLDYKDSGVVSLSPSDCVGKFTGRKLV